MSEIKTIKIEVNGKEFEAQPGQMLIEVTDANDIYVPRFCYHKKLSVAANCRMCLVEVEKAPKPLPACATPVMDGMKVFTKSPLAVEAQKSVMEFLLINHPLDCPICDQGGECELQDLAMGYGSDVSRYQEKKRVVKDKNIGPLVQTDMTRCIHCTRCVRFGEEIAGLRELGGTGRGEDMEIGTYIEKSMVSEMSGNVIDLCPVGALTSKPFRFSARTWEMKQFDGIAPHDPVGSNIHFHVKGNVVKRVVPAENEAINEVWLSDRDRFSYEGLYSEDRLTGPMIKQDGEWREVDWMIAFEEIRARLEKAIGGSGDKMGALVSASATTEELYLLQKFMRAMGSNNIDHRLQQIDFSDQEQAPVFPWLGQTISELEQIDAALVIGGNPRKEQPIINHRLRKTALKGGAVMMINSVDYELNYDLAAGVVVSPVELGRTLASVLKAVSESGHRIGDQNLKKLISGVQVNDEHRTIAQKLSEAEKATILLGNYTMTHPEFSTLRYLAGSLAKLTNAGFGYLSESANTSGAWLAGVLPHRETGGGTAANGLTVYGMMENELPAYLLFNVEPELDCWDGNLALKALNAAQCVIAFTSFKSEKMEEYADVLLPIAQYAENEGTYINMEGTHQTFAAVINPPGESRPGWKVLRVLGNSFELEGFDYDTAQQVYDEFKVRIEKVEPENMDAWLKPRKLAVLNDGIIRFTERPTNSIDPLVRRAPALQQTADVADGAVHVNEQMIAELGLSELDRVCVQQNGTELELPLVVDTRLPLNTVLIHAAHTDSCSLGPWLDEISLKRV